MFRRLNLIIKHAQHLGYAELGWLISRLKQVEWKKAREAMLTKEQSNVR